MGTFDEDYATGSRGVAPRSDSDFQTGLAVVISRLDDMKQDISDIRADQVSARKENVLRSEWEQRNSHVDFRFHTQGREIGDLRSELNSKRAPWWTWVTAIAALLALADTYLIP